mmetsp:Transcript_34874/g.102282  ORF Transcript_34874/g.102282 Transcript_34874/m.102282 type:complete len:115 (-) Transcript_34874:373-717(-)
MPSVDLRGGRYSLDRRKFGAVIGDGSQLGCGSVTEPGCLVAPNTHSYPLCRLPRGVYGPNELIKNRPHEAGVIACTPLREHAPAAEVARPMTPDWLKQAEVMLKASPSIEHGAP